MTKSAALLTKTIYRHWVLRSKETLLRRFVHRRKSDLEEQIPVKPLWSQNHILWGQLADLGSFHGFQKLHSQTIKYYIHSLFCFRENLLQGRIQNTFFRGFISIFLYIQYSKLFSICEQMFFTPYDIRLLICSNLGTVCKQNRTSKLIFCTIYENQNILSKNLN